MRRATVTIPDELERSLASYREDQEFPPSLAALVQAALKEYLLQRGYSSSGDEPAGPTVYEDAPAVRGDRTASQMVLEDRA